MKNNHSGKNKGPFVAVVSANRRIGEKFHRLGLEFAEAGAKTFAGATPGQFVELDLSAVALPAAKTIPEDIADAVERKILLRRPFSFCDITNKGKNTLVEILYCVVGPASLRMTTLVKGNTISVIGPLGNGFRLPTDKKTALLAAGGMGTGPLIHLAKLLKSDYPNVEAAIFVGAKTAKELPFEKNLDTVSKTSEFLPAEFARYGVKPQIATDDGSVGYHGFVTDCVQQWLDKHKPAGKDTIIYSCGPEAMLARLAEIAEEYSVDCQVSMEEMMACGIGLCQSCAVKCKAEKPGETIYKICCKDGTVFDSKEIVFRS